MSAFHDNALIGASGSQGYQISRSVRLRSSASAYFNRTPASAGSQTTWTLSMWLKRGALGANQTLFHAGTNNGPDSLFYFGANDTFDWIVRVATTATVARRTSTQVFRDPSAWAHIVCVWDTSNATAGSRMRVFYNGSEITAFSATTNPSLNLTSAFNGAVAHRLGYNTSNVQPFDGYLTEVNFIDGQALTPSSFGETNPVTGVWQPKKYTGTYGTNGFYLNFSDNSAATAATIGKDYSGNGNNWTPNNISVTAGATYDSMLDVPTLWGDGGNGRGNYATLNPLNIRSGASAVTFSNGNLNASFATGAAATNTVQSSFILPSGKWYAEASFTTITNTAIPYVGVIRADYNYTIANTGQVMYIANGNRVVSGTTSAYAATYAANDVIGMAVDTDAGTIEFFKNGASQGVITSTANIQPNLVCFSVLQGGNSESLPHWWNFGQRPFAYTPPSGFKALNTLNLPDATIKNGAQYMAATTYTGNGSTQSIVNTVNGVSFQPDLVWIKRRQAAADHALYDSSRTLGVALASNSTGAEGAVVTNGLMTAYNSNGFSVAVVSSDNTTNGTAGSYVGWQWKEGATQGFDIVTYTGTGANRTVAHNLGVAPRMIIIKRRDITSNWVVWHGTFTGLQYLNLESTAAVGSLASVWNSTVPTSSVFSLGTDAAVNGNGGNLVAYLFAEVAGFSKFGSYTGNGSADGPFVFCGFRPRFILIKSTSSATENWIIHDTARDVFNQSNNSLAPNTSGAEVAYASSQGIDVTSNGFKLRVGGSPVNTSTGTYIFAAFAENPFKVSLAR